MPAVPTASSSSSITRSSTGTTPTTGPAGRRRGTMGGPTTATGAATSHSRSEEHTSELQSQSNLVCRLLLEKKKIPRSPPETKRVHARANQNSSAAPPLQPPTLLLHPCVDAVLAARAATSHPAQLTPHDPLR